MANLEILSNVLHQGIILKKGMIVSDVQRDLSSVAQDLISRDLARETTAEPTHSLALTNGAQEAISVTASPSVAVAANVDSDAEAKAAAKAAQVVPSDQTVNDVNDTAGAEAQIVDKTSGNGSLLSRAKAALGGSAAPSIEDEVAATAAQVE